MRKRLLQNQKEQKDNLETAHTCYSKLFKEGLIAGLGWAIGVTVGFVTISTILAIILSMLGGLPLVGNWIANIVEATQEQLLKRTPLFNR